MQEFWSTTEPGGHACRLQTVRKCYCKNKSLSHNPKIFSDQRRSMLSLPTAQSKMEKCLAYLGNGIFDKLSYWRTSLTYWLIYFIKHIYWHDLNCSIKDSEHKAQNCHLLWGKKKVVKRCTLYFFTLWHLIRWNRLKSGRDMVISLLVDQVLKITPKPIDWIL